jgi:CBS domain-containing protein
MTTNVVTVGQTALYKEVVDTLTKHGVSAVPVVNEGGHVVGMVSEADLLHKLEFAGLEPHVRLVQRRRRRVARTKASGASAGELMSAPPVVVGPQESLSAVARLMDSERVKRLPVVDRDARLVGIVSRRDLLRVYLREDEAIAEEILEQVLVRTLWIEPDTVSVTVEDGVVTLAGTVDRRSTVPLLVRLVDGVGGVVGVVDHLTYHFDDTAELDRRNVMGTAVR